MNYSPRRIWCCFILLFVLAVGAQAQDMSPSDLVIGDWAASDGARVTFEYHSETSLKMLLPNGQALVVGTTVTDGGKVMIDFSGIAAGAVGMYDRSSETITIYENNQQVETWTRP